MTLRIDLRPSDEEWSGLRVADVVGTVTYIREISTEEFPGVRRIRRRRRTAAPTAAAPTAAAPAAATGGAGPGHR